MPLTADRDTPRRDGVDFEFPMALGVTCFAGAIVCLSATGFATPGAVATTLKAVGVAKEKAVGGAANGDTTVKVKKGVYRFANSSAGDLIALDDVGANCYIVDDQTVALTNGGSTRSVAGKIVDVDAVGVWVEFA